MNDTSKQILDQHRRALLQSLVDLGVEGRSGEEARRVRLQGEALLASIRDIEETLVMLGRPSAPNKYAGMKRGIDAVVAHLAEVGRAQEREQIVKAVVAGGLRGGVGAAPVARRSISAFLTGASRNTHTLRKVGDLIGLFDWPDDHFRA